MSDSNSFLQSAGLSAGSGLLNFGLGQIGAAIQWNREKKKMKIQQENALEQMAKSQEYNLANMEKQNEYQIAAEQRANEYNSIGAQVERARQAGVSSLAAIGSGGAGGLMSVSSAPSGATPSGSSPSGGAPAGPQAQYFDFARAADIGADIQLKKSQADAAAAQAERDRAHAANLNQETADKQWYNANVRNLDKKLKEAGVTSAQAKATVDKLNAAYEAYISAQGDIERSEKYQAFKLQLDKVRSEIGELQASAVLKTEQTTTEQSEQALNAERIQTEKSVQALNKLEKEHREKYDVLIREAKSISNVYELANTVISLTTGMPLGSTCWQWLGAIANRLSFNEQSDNSLKSLINSLESRLSDSRTPKDIVETIKSTTNPEQFADALRKLNKINLQD